MKAIIENEDGTLIIDDKLHRLVKGATNNVSNAANTKEAVFLSLTKGLLCKQTAKGIPIVSIG